MKVEVQSLRPIGPILVLDDEEPLAGAICSQLRREGFDAVPLSMASPVSACSENGLPSW
ncbi:MAG: hypothetical protein JWM17_3051 [Actinobacteria bacterium]|nr:hypothetical protein [Actinomycetota bacterium]